MGVKKVGIYIFLKYYSSFKCVHYHLVTRDKQFSHHGKEKKRNKEYIKFIYLIKITTFQSLSSSIIIPHIYIYNSEKKGLDVISQRPAIKIICHLQ